jgi:putative intracellular protease/amidase
MMKHVERIKLTSLVLLLCSSVATFSQLPQQEPKNVAIFLYQNVELLDFAGPGEVFSSAGFNTYTVSVDGKALVSQRFVTIQPQYSIDNAPVPDIVVFPGGNSAPSANDPNVITWIKNLYGNGTDFMSVCTGAFIIAKAGLLDNKRVTTHYGSSKGLAEKYSNTTVLEKTRWVDSGNVITTAGVSAGIDGALHFVSRVKGLDAAKNVARYMEYDKWNPENGVVDKRNEYLEVLLVSTENVERPSVLSKGYLLAGYDMPYMGEFKNRAAELSNQGEYAQAKKILDAGVKLYPEVGLLYTALGDVNRKLGKQAPMSESYFVDKVREGKIDEAMVQFEKDKKAFPRWKIFSEDALKSAAYYLLLTEKDVAGALKAFQLNTREYPQSADAFDSLGEAYLVAGRKEEGIACYQKAASMGYENAVKVLRDLVIQ